MEEEIERLKKQLGLGPHPSGFGRLYRHGKQTDRHSGPRAAGTSIYFLLAPPNTVTWHKHLSDEVHMLQDDGTHSCHVLGDVVNNAECVGQIVVPHDTWYSAELVDKDRYALYSAVVMPGFEFEDWIDGKREELLAKFPQHKELIERLTCPS